MCFRGIYETSKTREEAQRGFQDWFQQVDASKFDSFKTAAHYLEDHLPNHPQLLPRPFHQRLC